MTTSFTKPLLCTVCDYDINYIYIAPTLKSSTWKTGQMSFCTNKFYVSFVNYRIHKTQLITTKVRRDVGRDGK